MSNGAATDAVRSALRAGHRGVDVTITLWDGAQGDDSAKKAFEISRARLGLASCLP
jgi:hypothetical protein